MGFRERWISCPSRAATGTEKTRTLLTPIGTTIFCLFTIFFVLAAIFVDRLLDLPDLLPEGLRLPVSIPVIAVIPKADGNVHSRPQTEIEFESLT